MNLSKFLMLILIGSFFGCLGQKQSHYSVQKFPDLYKGNSILFDTLIYDYLSPKFKNRYSLSVTFEDIVLAEKLITRLYNCYVSKDSRFNGINSTIENPKLYFEKYNRQYYGFKSDGKKYLFVVMLNFANKKNAKNYFPDWDKYISIGNGDFYGSNQQIFIVNLTDEDFIIP